MLKRIARRALLPALLLATTALGGCYVAPYPAYYGYRPYAYPAYAVAPVYGGVYVGGWHGHYWR